MRQRQILVTCTVISCLALSATALAGNPEAARAFADGQAALVKGDFAVALENYKAAAKADPDNKLYADEFALLRRVINVREQLKTETDAEAWQQMARALHGYYTQYKLTGEALVIAQALHAKAPTPQSMLCLAAAEIAAGKDTDAITLLAALPSDQQSPESQVLHGLALAHTGKLTEAKALATSLELPKDCGGQLCYDAARLYALTGDSSRALATLKCAFECTPAPMLDGLKADAKASPDLANVATAPEFAQVLETKSKMPAGCGSAAGCGGCSKSKTCAPEQKSSCGHEEKTAEGGKQAEPCHGEPAKK
jgi:thioredoxin-like negative regulator of GroEL